MKQWNDRANEGDATSTAQQRTYARKWYKILSAY